MEHNEERLIKFMSYGKTVDELAERLEAIDRRLEILDKQIAAARSEIEADMLSAEYNAVNKMRLEESLKKNEVERKLLIFEKELLLED